MTPRLYAPELAASLDRVELGADAAHYLGQVLRLRPGADVECFDGLGQRFACEIDTIERRHVLVRVVGQPKSRQAAYPRITLIQALASGDKADWIVEKATEAGVARLIMFVAERGTAKVNGERLTRKLAHWRRVSIAACAQCGSDYLPELIAQGSLSEALRLVDSALAVASPIAETSLATWLTDVASTPASLGIVIGPESGLSDAEVDKAVEHGASAVSLGPRVWRTETAGLAAIITAHAVIGDLR